MPVEMPIQMGRAVGRPLVKAHRIGKRRLEQIVLMEVEAAEKNRQLGRLDSDKLVQRAIVSSRKKHGLLNGQIAQNGTSTTKCSFWQTMRSPAFSSSAK